jgi:hypothetical protein
LPAACTFKSLPVEKARSPAPVTMPTQRSGLWANSSQTAGSQNHLCILPRSDTQAFGDSKTSFDLSERQHTAARGQFATLDAGGDRLAAFR